jgi:membrane protease YdiL (CAAX protease family)
VDNHPSFIKRHSLVIGIAVMFLFTWPISLAASGVMPYQVPDIVATLDTWGFVVAALLMTGITLGKEGVVALLKRFLIWRVRWTWYLAALFLLPAILTATFLLRAAITQTRVDFSNVYAYEMFGPDANLPLFIVPLLVVFAIINAEEIGWRGYVLPRLQTKSSALVSSLIIGVIWGLWHYPYYLAPGWDTSAFGWLILGAIPNSILFTWLYNNTRGSLLLLTLFHASINTAGAFLPILNFAGGFDGTELIIQIALTSLVAIGVIVIYGPEQLSRKESKQVQALVPIQAEAVVAD